MTNEEIEIIKIVFQSYLNIVQIFKKPNYISEKVVTEARDKLIKELEQQPCEDCISREDAINELKLAYFNKDLQSAKDDPCIVDAMTDWAIRTIKNLPSVTPQPKSEDMGR